MGLLIILCLFAAFACYVCRPGRDVDSRNIYSCIHRGWRRIAFWAGDVRLLSGFPWITWSHIDFEVPSDVWMEALKLVRPGDVILAKEHGFFFSNTAIPGLFKHAAIIVTGPTCKENLCDICDCRVVEAISEGVILRHPIYTRGDYMIVLRPKNVSSEDITKAVKIATQIVGSDYDDGFKFNIERELTILSSEDLNELNRVKTNLQAEYDLAFSCTETVATAWWHCRHLLRLYRQYTRGREVIVADQFVNNGFDIVWTNVQNDVAKKHLHEEGRLMFEDYWSKH